MPKDSGNLKYISGFNGSGYSIIQETYGAVSGNLCFGLRCNNSRLIAIVR